MILPRRNKPTEKWSQASDRSFISKILLYQAIYLLCPSCESWRFRGLVGCRVSSGGPPTASITGSFPNTPDTGEPSGCSTSWLPNSYRSSDLKLHVRTLYVVCTIITSHNGHDVMPSTRRFLTAIYNRTACCSPSTPTEQLLLQPAI